MNKALFLDRDGIINIDHGYVYKKEDFEFIEGIFELCQKAISLHYKIIVITNQAGIARGYYTQNDFLTLTQWMENIFQQHNVEITDVFYCPHHPTNGVNEFKKECNCRKPAPGMILIAQQKHNISLKESIFIGDKESDMIAAKNAGIEKRILVSSQYVQTSAYASHSEKTVKEVIKHINK